MRKLIVTALLAFAVSATACKEPDPNKFETHIERIRNADSRNTGFSGLETLTKTVVTASDNEDLLQEFADKVIPVFEEVWDDAEEQQEKMLVMLRDVGRPEAAELWSKAVELDGSAEARKKTLLALDGIKKAKAVDAAPAIIEELDKVIASPNLDQGDSEEGRLRVTMAQTLGILGDPKAVPVLIKAMEQTKEVQPVRVHRYAAKALGQIGDPSAVDALLTVTFRVPDAPTTTNIGERSKVALVSIGEPAVPKVLQMLRGEHDGVQKLAAENGVPQQVIQQTAAGILGAMGAKSAADELIAYMPKEVCGDGGKPFDDTDEELVAAAALRAVIANALGFIGDPKAAEPLCSCVGKTANPGDTFPIMEALGRVGGPKAVECLTDMIKTGKYDDEAVEKEFLYEPRWEAGRFAVLAAGPGDIGTVKEAIAAADRPEVKEKLAPWQAGVELVETCKNDNACYQATLSDVNADWFPREKAAFAIARNAQNDLEMAEEIAKAFKVRSPDARVNMAWLPTQMLGDEKCPACVSAYQDVLDAEKMSMDAQYQASVLMVRATMARLRGKDQADQEAE